VHEIENSQSAEDLGPAKSESTVGPAVVVLLLLIVMVGIFVVPMLFTERRNARILKEGVPAKARVMTIVSTGNFHNDQPEVRMLLEVRPDAGEPFDSQLDTYMSPVYLSRFQPGSIVDVRFDPKRHIDVALVPP
jgi:hypothetical protein